MTGAAPRRAEEPVLHATLIAARRLNGWRGVLLQGRSGAGKSDLALRAIAGGWRLVADDRVHIWTSGGGVYGAAPARLAGLLEVRGVGVRPEPTLPFVRLALAIEASSPGAPVERMPEPGRLGLLGTELPRLRLALCEPSALAKLERGLDAALQRRL
jgi:serine kinase of HPr protein (carbohydrate metabolism regulator)